LTASETALAAWLQGWQAIETTVKLIPYIGRKDRESSRVWSQANQRLIGETSRAVQLTPADAATGQAAVLECTLDVGGGSATTRIDVSSVHMSALTVDVGFVIQADTAAETTGFKCWDPFIIHGVDPLQAFPKLS
jgi:hypothetical protein